MNSVTDGNLLDLDNAPEEAFSDCGDQAMLIERARLRCLAGGLQKRVESVAADHDVVAGRAKPLADSQNRQLLAHALPVMELLAMQLAPVPGAAVLADGNGTLLHMLGDAGFLSQAGRRALRCGVCWSEANKGTNAIGTALAEQAPVAIRGDEHYFHANRFLAGAAAPIFVYNGSTLGLLAVVTERDGLHRHALETVRVSAQMVENRMVSTLCRDAIILRFGARPDCAGTLAEGIASFTPDGRFLWANRIGEAFLGMPLSTLRVHTMGSLFGLPVSVLTEHYCSATPDLLELHLESGRVLFGRPELPALRLMHGPARRVENAHATTTHTPSGRMSGLRFLNTGDPQVGTVISKLNKVVGCNIPILINGETGTGKELLAHAIHEDSPRAKGPFVAVNCASIPETLIESELFGYEDGAFTGARKKGCVGKILQADGGTLFLDEIGDMPLNLQACLLRVLQERRVTPLGSAKAIPVNVELICATNRNLREMIARGEFREDLYYRLNGLVVKLPPARERTDLGVVIDKILRTESDELRHKVAPDVMQLFKRHRWPGNFRQMRSVLRTALIMARDDSEIRREHLPDDFLDEVSASRSGADERRDAQMERAAAGYIDLEALELAAIRKALEAHDGNVSAAARMLGISRNTIYRKIGAQE